MPLWKIAWRSIQRRWLASVLTMFSMALGVMLVVAVLLIVGVVDESFRTNSSLGYDTIVGAKGGELQLTLNTVYYLSKPVENLPFEFYRQFLPAKKRKDREAAIGRDFEDRVEVLSPNGDWSDSREIIIPAGETGADFRVPLLAAERNGPLDFTVTVEVTSKNVVNRVTRRGVTINPQKRVVREEVASKPALPKTSPASTNDDGESSTESEPPGQPSDGDAAEIGEIKATEPSPENPSMEDPSSETLTQEQAEAFAARFADLPPALLLEPRDIFTNDEHAQFHIRLDAESKTPVVITVGLSAGADGRYYEYLTESETAVVPVCLGDYYLNYRVVGTIPPFFDIIYDRQNQRKYEFASGGNFTSKTEGYGIYEAILGARVARDTGLRVGDVIHPSHGAPSGTENATEHRGFIIVGVLASTGTPQDRAVFVNMDGFNEIPDHIRDDGLKEVTALLVDTKDPMTGTELKYQLTEEPVGQAVSPIGIIYSLFDSIVGPMRNVLLVITGVICFVSGISILVSIYNSMNDRKQEIAVMRSLGAGRGTVMAIVLLESVMISMAGGVLGWMAGHAMIGIASQKIEEETGVIVSAFQLAPPLHELSYLLGPQLTPTISVEIWLIPGLILLAILVGFMPALAAYRTDVAEALQSSP